MTKQRERAKVNRRGFLGGAGVAAMGAAVGSAIPFAQQMPSGLVPLALAESEKKISIPG